MFSISKGSLIFVSISFVLSLFYFSNISMANPDNSCVEYCLSEYDSAQAYCDSNYKVCIDDIIGRGHSSVNCQEIYDSCSNSANKNMSSCMSKCGL
ncbi:MAG: hypothetical protein HQK49_06525 [Oligoflexia bacterium]|nr:hypothetical protein [Oligoflexia bacterium]